MEFNRVIFSDCSKIGPTASSREETHIYIKYTFTLITMQGRLAKQRQRTQRAWITAIIISNVSQVIILLK